MDARPREILMFETEDGKVPFSDWIAAYAKEEIYGALLARIERVEEGNFGDCVWEGPSCCCGAESRGLRQEHWKKYNA